MIEITCINSDGVKVSQPYTVSTYNSPYNYQPVFSLSRPIKIPDNLWEKVPYKKDYPIQFTIELIGTADKFNFDVMLIYDEA